jgi:hypothetical protein
MLLDRRAVLHSLGAAAALLPIAGTAALSMPPEIRRVRPGDPDWPSPALWEELNRAVGGRLIRAAPRCLRH